MKRLRLIESVPGHVDLLRITPRSFARIAFGVVLLAVGGGFLIGAIAQLTGQSAAYIPYVVLGLLIGLVLTAGGVALIVERSGFDFDRHAGELTAWRSYIVLHRRRVFDLEDLTGIVITRYWLFNRVARSENEHFYRLAIRHATHPQLIEIGERLRGERATSISGVLAAYLDLPIIERKGRAEGVVAGR